MRGEGDLLIREHNSGDRSGGLVNHPFALPETGVYRIAAREFEMSHIFLMTPADREQALKHLVLVLITFSWGDTNILHFRIKSHLDIKFFVLTVRTPGTAEVTPNRGCTVLSPLFEIQLHLKRGEDKWKDPVETVLVFGGPQRPPSRCSRIPSASS